MSEGQCQKTTDPACSGLGSEVDKSLHAPADTGCAGGPASAAGRPMPHSESSLYPHNGLLAERQCTHGTACKTGGDAEPPPHTTPTGLRHSCCQQFDGAGRFGSQHRRPDPSGPAAVPTSDGPTAWEDSSVWCHAGVSWPLCNMRLGHSLQAWHLVHAHAS